MSMRRLLCWECLVEDRERPAKTVVDGKALCRHHLTPKLVQTRLTRKDQAQLLRAGK